jgi:hypothetical protein
MAWQVGTARQHLLRRSPIRPFALGGDRLHARPGETGTADADTIAQRTAVTLYEIKDRIPDLRG